MGRNEATREDGEEIMSHMDTHAAFAPAGGIQELSFDEIDQVDGAGVFSFIKKFFDWFSRVTPGVKITIFGIEVSDGIPNGSSGSTGSGSGISGGGNSSFDNNTKEL